MKLLIVDDEKNLRRSIAEYFALEGIETEEAENGLSAQKLLSEKHFDGAVVDLKMPGMDGLELLRWLREEGPDIPTVMISAFGDVEDAVAAMKLGASDYVTKPFDPEELRIRVARSVEDKRLRDMASSRRKVSAETAGNGTSRNPAMQRIYALAGKVAPTDATVLIGGESGTGKEVLARLLHARSLRADGPFVAVNLGAIPDTLLESELFGYERGAFTGADRRKEGLFEIAAAGTLFLDEIGELPLRLQVKLLRALQERKIQRLGGTALIPAATRIIAATNRDLESEVRNGRFREDLYYRINVIRFVLPPLRERREDIPYLAAELLRRSGERVGRKIDRISPEAVRLLLFYSFPGNVRELENMIERAVILSEGDTVEPRDFALPESMTALHPEPAAGTLREMEKQAIARALLRNEGRRQQSADELGITRRTLLNKIKEYGLEEPGRSVPPRSAGGS